MNYKYSNIIDGKEIFTNDGETWYNEDGTIYKRDRICKRCGYPPTKEGYDHCLGYIEGAVSACCMHGEGKGYIIFKDGRRVEI